VMRAVIFPVKQPGSFVRKAALWALVRATSRAFDCPAPSLAGLSADACLLRYAQFTQGQVAALLRDSGDVALVGERLYRNAYRLGRVFRWAARIRTLEDAMELDGALYRLLEIDLQSKPHGDVVFSCCYFSRFYTGQVCQVMSAMDRGLLAGLSGGKQLVFSARITEGHPCCRAHVNGEENRQA
jgi:hypothetical protein